MTDEINQASAHEETEINILRIYLKDISFETPNSPEIFFRDFKPEVSIQLNTSIEKINEERYEVVLSITVTTTQENKTGFLVEVQQAGIFSVQGFDEEKTNRILGITCPNTLFPYARETITGLVTKGGFPPLLLAPINFGAMYDTSTNQPESIE